MKNEWRNAALQGNHEAITNLIADGVDADCLDKFGQTALMLAALHGHEQIVSILLTHGAKMDVTAKHGLSALMLAIINNRTRVALQLVDAGADVSIIGRGDGGFYGKSAYDFAVDRGMSELALQIKNRIPS
jgi:ankyrin repeat protein